MTPRPWTIFGATILLLFVVLYIAIPYGFGLQQPLDADAVPLTEEFHRIDLIRAVARRAPATRCVILGDSRAAFQIDAAAMGIPGCKPANLAFPGMAISYMHDVLNDALEPELTEVDGVVLSLTLEMFLANSTSKGEFLLGAPRPRPQTFRDHLLLSDLTLLRAIGRGQWLLAMWIDRLRGHSFPRHGWTFRGDLGRWEYDSLSGRVFPEISGHVQEMKELAFRYFVNRRLSGTIEANLRLLFAAATREDRDAIVVLPPEYPDFAPWREERLPGAYERFRNMLDRVAAEFGVRVVDCHAPERCGLQRDMFADAVHLNARGAAAYTSALGRRIAEALTPRPSG